MNEDFFYKSESDDFEKIPSAAKTGLATASFIISLVNLIFFAFTLSFILSPISIILGVVSLVKRQGGKAFAVLGIVISSVSIVIFGIVMSVFVKVYPDMEYFIRNDTAIISEFEESGEIPEQFDKYRSPEYDKYWKKSGLKNFDEFFAFFIDVYKQTQGIQTVPSSPDNPSVPAFPPDDGEELVVL